MSRVVPAADIEAIVGVPRGSVRHFARKVPADGQIYILHSEVCRAVRPDLTLCPFSLALDEGVDDEDWPDTPVTAAVTLSGWLLPASLVDPSTGERWE